MREVEKNSPSYSHVHCTISLLRVRFLSFPVYTVIKGHVIASGNTQSVSIILATDIEPLEEILSSEAAELLSCALKHQRMTDRTRKLTNPYFTDEEWERVMDNRTELLDDADELLDGLGTAATTHDRARDWIERKRQLPLCGCKAHKCHDDVYGRPSGVGNSPHPPPPLNDDSGNVFASVFLTHILNVANLTRVTVRGTLEHFQTHSEMHCIERHRQTVTP